MFAEASLLLSVQRLFLLMLTLFVASIVCGAFVISPGTEVIYNFFYAHSAEHEIYPAHKC